MRTAVISDIHGNLEAFIRVLEDIQNQRIDRIFSLGDNIGYGADSEKVMQLLITHNIPTVLGNHEMAALHDNVLNWYRGETRRAVEIAVKSLSNDSLSYLKASALSFSKFGCSFVHGFPPDSCRVYLHQIGEAQLLNTIKKMDDDCCFVGHTHKLKIIGYDNHEISYYPTGQNNTSLILRKDNKYIINAGSVGQPRDGSITAKYVIRDSVSNRIEIRAVDYDVSTAAKKILLAGIPSKFADILEQSV